MNERNMPELENVVEIREGQINDAERISHLLTQLNYPVAAGFVEARLPYFIAHPDALLIVATDSADELIGFVSLHFIPQLALAGDFCRISYFCVSQQNRSLGVGRLLEEKVVEAARLRGCDRIELHCHKRRDRAHSFYFRQGYTEDPKYLLKKLR
ncbi:MAG: GNAT family N-acetyltransferase [Phormidesmis sp.]